MPIHDAHNVEYSIVSGHITIVNDDGQRVPAYWAHPALGEHFSGIALFHDWWGIDRISRLLSNFFAQMGYYVITPDLFMGKTASTPREAMKLLAATRYTRYKTAAAALEVLETHHRTNRSVAAIGIGMGGTLAFEAAIKRDDLEAAVSYAGFPQSYLGQFKQSNTPILAVYGSHEPYTRPVVVKALHQELMQSHIRDEHDVLIVDGAAHTFFTAEPDPEIREWGRQAINRTMEFLFKHLEQPEQPGDRKVY